MKSTSSVSHHPHLCISTITGVRVATRRFFVGRLFFVGLPSACTLFVGLSSCVVVNFQRSTPPLIPHTTKFTFIVMRSPLPNGCAWPITLVPCTSHGLVRPGPSHAHHGRAFRNAKLPEDGPPFSRRQRSCTPASCQPAFSWAPNPYHEGLQLLHLVREMWQYRRGPTGQQWENVYLSSPPRAQQRRSAGL